MNTIAADSKGKAYYADIGSVPNVSNAKIADCIGRARRRSRTPSLRVQVLDGVARRLRLRQRSRRGRARRLRPVATCRRCCADDYVTNGNDSYWLSNPEQPLEGFSRVIGDERTARSPRTRLGLRIVQERLDGSDGLPGKRFTLRQLQDAVFNNRQYLGELWRDELVAGCRLGRRGLPVLRDWDLHDNLDSRGALLFRRFASRALTNPASASLPPAPSPFAMPFDRHRSGQHAARPRTPLARRCRPGARQARCPTSRARASRSTRRWATSSTRSAATRRSRSTAARARSACSTRSTSPGTRRRATPNVPHGSSYVQAVELPKGKCARVRTILTYSQSAISESPLVRRPDADVLQEEVGQAALLPGADAQGEVRLAQALQDPDLAVVADHEAVGARLARPAGDDDVLPSSEDSMRPSRSRT